MATKYLDQAALAKMFTISKGWIDSIPEYELPKATTETLGGVKAGAGVSVSAGGVMSVNADAVKSVSWGGVTGKSNATSSVAGIVKIGTGIDVNNGVISVTHPVAYTKDEADAKYRTQTQAQADISAEITKMVAGAPASLDTLKEIATALDADAEGSIVNGIMSELSGKAVKSEVYNRDDSEKSVEHAFDTLEAKFPNNLSRVEVKSTIDSELAKIDLPGQIKSNDELFDETFLFKKDVVAYTAAEIEAMAASV